MGGIQGLFLKFKQETTGKEDLLERDLFGEISCVENVDECLVNVLFYYITVVCIYFYIVGTPPGL